MKEDQEAKSKPILNADRHDYPRHYYQQNDQRINPSEGLIAESVLDPLHQVFQITILPRIEGQISTIWDAIPPIKMCRRPFLFQKPGIDVGGIAQKGG